MSNGGDQHIYPASLIGMFSAEEGPVRRRRKVYVARRDLGRVLPQVADRAGLLGRPHDHLYDNHDRVRPDLDDFWQCIEETIPLLDETIHRVARGGQLYTSDFVKVWVPYIAHLLARPPRVSLNEHHDLRDNASTPTDRYRLFATYADSFLLRTEWSLVTTTPAHPLLSNDGGYAVMPGGSDFAPAVVVPLSRTVAVRLAVSPDPTFNRKRARTEVPVYRWHPQDIAALNELFTGNAGREVYADTHDRATHAVDLWDGTSEPHYSHAGVDARVFTATAVENTAHVLIGGAPPNDDPWSRYLIARHRYGCDCAKFRHPDACPNEATGQDEYRFFQARQYWARFRHRPDLKSEYGSRFAVLGGKGIAWATPHGILTGPRPPESACAGGIWRHVGPPLRTT